MKKEMTNRERQNIRYAVNMWIDEMIDNGQYPVVLIAAAPGSDKVDMYNHGCLDRDTLYHHLKLAIERPNN
jgi:hypothetical protein